MYMIVRWRRHNGGDGGDCILGVCSIGTCVNSCALPQFWLLSNVFAWLAKPKIGNVPSHPATICAIFIRSGQWALGESVCGGSGWPSCLPEFYIQLWVLFMLQLLGLMEPECACYDLLLCIKHLWVLAKSACTYSFEVCTFSWNCCWITSYIYNALLLLIIQVPWYFIYHERIRV